MLRKPANLRLKVPLFLLSGGILALWVALRIPCPVRHFTGLICPGCGLGRAWLAALRLDFSQAFRSHPLFWAVPVLAVFVLYDCRIFRKRQWNTLVLAGLLLAAALCYLIRLAAFVQGNLSI